MKRFLGVLFAAAMFATAVCAATASTADLDAARDKQDLGALDKLIAQGQQASQSDPVAQHRLAVAYSYASEVALEIRDKKKAQSYAEAGMDPAKRAISKDESNAEYHRALGQLCGQVIPANPIFGFKYGQCARDEIDKAIRLDGKLALAYVSRGVGNSYLPAQMGGGIDLAIKDCDKAISLDPKACRSLPLERRCPTKGQSQRRGASSLRKGCPT